MRITYTVESLDTADAWASLADALGDGHPEAVHSTIRHLRILGVKSYVLEDPYIDRDYSADYLHYYARTFRTHARHCKRAHFFSDDISPLLGQPRSTEQLRQLRQVARSGYCGFCVIRPLATAPIACRMYFSKYRGSQNFVASALPAIILNHYKPLTRGVTFKKFLKWSDQKADWSDQFRDHVSSSRLASVIDDMKTSIEQF